MKSSTFRLLLVLLALVALIGIFTSIPDGNDDPNNCSHEFDYSKREIEQAGDCVTDEIGKITCKKCNYKEAYLIEAKGAHKFGTEIITYRNDSDSSHNIVSTKTCSVCNYKDETVRSEAHVLGDPLTFPFKFATCAEEGNVAFECEICHYAVTKTLPKLPIHTYHDANCTVCGVINPDYDGTPNNCAHANKSTSYGDSISGYDNYCAVSYDWYCFECGEFGGLKMYCNTCQTGSCYHCDCH